MTLSQSLKGLANMKMKNVKNQNKIIPYTKFNKVKVKVFFKLIIFKYKYFNM